MVSSPLTPRRPPTGRRRGRPPKRTQTAADAASEPPSKRRKYIPGGPGGGGRFIDETGAEIPANSTRPVTTPRPPAASPKRQRSTRTRTIVSRFEPEEEHFSSAAAVAAAVVQSEGYKPREERGWEEFHPNLDIEATFMVLHAEDVDGTAKSAPQTPGSHSRGTPANGASTPSKEAGRASTSGDNTPNAQEIGAFSPALNSQPGTPLRRRVGRPPREPVSYYATALTPKTPKVLPIHNQTPKERLDLKLPSYRRTDRILLFESKTFGQAKYVEKSMSNVGYQESDNYGRPDKLLKPSDAKDEDEVEVVPTIKTASASAQDKSDKSGNVGRVEYDMDEQDDVWLTMYNQQRTAAGCEQITREFLEIAITKIEKEWHALEKKIPKPNPKPPQTHRPRSSSAAAVNGETHAGEEQDSKCAICDDGDCENTNAIVFCDGCDLAVHQECYGVPFIPEGQWLCRKCQLIGRGIPVRSPALAAFVGRSF
jgi:NuA3 HAT complex component NTO1